MSMTMSSETFHRLRELIYGKSGLEFPESKKYLLESRLQARLVAVHCQNFEEYYNFLRFDPQREQETIELFNCVTTNETFFFRDMAQMDCFRQVILPHIIKARERIRKIRIWSAGCSSGEEPFTLAMIITEEFPSLANWDVQIFATDLSEKILATARRGVYGPYSVRNISPNLLPKYFIQSDGHYTVGPSLRKLVNFSSVNLFDNLRMRSFRDIDIIFCRNVLIYFDQEARRKIVTSFYDALQDTGVMMIGFSESLSGVNRLFRPTPWNKTVMYHKANQAVSGAPVNLTSMRGQTPAHLDMKSGEPVSGRGVTHSPLSSPLLIGGADSSKKLEPKVGSGNGELKREPRWSR